MESSVRVPDSIGWLNAAFPPREELVKRDVLKGWMGLSLTIVIPGMIAALEETSTSFCLSSFSRLFHDPAVTILMFTFLSVRLIGLA